MRASLLLLASSAAFQSVFASDVFVSSSSLPNIKRQDNTTNSGIAPQFQQMVAEAEAAQRAAEQQAASEFAAEHNGISPDDFYAGISNGTIDPFAGLAGDSNSNSNSTTASLSRREVDSIAGFFASLVQSGALPANFSLFAPVDQNVAKRSPEPNLLDILGSLFGFSSNGNKTSSGQQAGRRNGTTKAGAGSGSGRASSNSTATAKSSLRSRVTVADLNAIADATAAKVRRQQEDLDADAIALINKVFGSLSRGNNGNDNSNSNTNDNASSSTDTTAVATTTTTTTTTTTVSTATATGQQGSSALTTGTTGRSRGGAVGAAAAVRAGRKNGADSIQ